MTQTKIPNMIWTVKETACYPNSFKIVPSIGKESNGVAFYFPTDDEAQSECDRRNKLEN